jgi:hypothetical protein
VWIPADLIGRLLTNVWAPAGLIAVQRIYLVWIPAGLIGRRSSLLLPPKARSPVIYLQYQYQYQHQAVPYDP